jgi:tRNA nucleotidyltransferase/poly(A) polymerase
VFNKYDQFLESTTSKTHHEKAQQRKKAFYDYVEKRAIDELDKALKESDPYQRLKLLQEYPPELLKLTPLEKRLGDEQRLARGEAERKFLKDETALDEMLRTGKFKEGRPLLDHLLVVAPAASRDRLERLKSDLNRLEKEFEDGVLRKLSDRFAQVHASCEASLVKRQTAAGYFGVTKFVKELALEESTRARVQGVNYDMLHNAATEKAFKDTALDGVRSSLRKAFLNPKDDFPYRILTDLQDALDLELLIVAASQGMYALSRKTD